MNKTEAKAYNWLTDKFKGLEIVFQRRINPDFIDSNGNGYEVKLLRGNAITFSEGQLEKLIKFGKVTIILMNDKNPEPIALIPIKELKDNPPYWKQYRIKSFASYQHPITDFHCQDCGRSFKAPQGSRRFYCAECRYKHNIEANQIAP